ncbi:hypothetical protein C8R44DRAFT_893193 [Mycena epipterygia]|nr:hypothetical protein C8R44DRAFT_893193 [Mycena epipterygia]
MPHQPTLTDLRLNNIIACLGPTVTLLNEVNDAFGIPFLKAISSTTVSLINAVQNVKRNKDECIFLMENIHGILYAIVDLHIKSETTGSLPPAILDHIGKFTETLHKIHTFLAAQQEGNKIKHFFHHGEMNTLRKDCHAGLEQALQMFKVEAGLLTAASVAELQRITQNLHLELLELVDNISDGSISDKSSMYQSISDSQKR